MHVIRRRGWEIPEKSGHAGALVPQPARVLVAAARCARRIALCGCERWPTRHRSSRSDRRSLSGQANAKYPLDRAADRGEDRANYNNFYEFGADKESSSRRAGAEASGPGR